MIVINVWLYWMISTQKLKLRQRVVYKISCGNQKDTVWDLSLQVQRAQYQHSTVVLGANNIMLNWSSPSKTEEGAKFFNQQLNSSLSPSRYMCTLKYLINKVVIVWANQDGLSLTMSSQTLTALENSFASCMSAISVTVLRVPTMCWRKLLNEQTSAAIAWKPNPQNRSKSAQDARWLFIALGSAN